MGGFFSRELFETTFTSSEDPRGEHALCNPSEGCVSGPKTGGHHIRRDRRLPSAASSAAGTDKTSSGLPGKGDPEVEHGASGVSGAPSHVERGGPEKATPGESMRWGGVSSGGKRVIPAALCYLVGTANHRSPCSRIFAQHCEDHHRNRVAHL